MSRGPIPDKAADRPTVPEVRELVRAYYEKEGNSCGGNLHIVLDDGNLSDSCVQFCLDQVHADEDEDGVRIAELMLQMTGTQRRKV